MFINIFGYSREIAARELYGSAPPVSDIGRSRARHDQPRATTPRELSRESASTRRAPLLVSRLSIAAFTDFLSELGWHVRARDAV